MYPLARRVCLQRIVAFPGRWRCLSSTNALMSVKENENWSSGRDSSASLSPVNASYFSFPEELFKLDSTAHVCWLVSGVQFHISTAGIYYGFTLVLVYAFNNMVPGLEDHLRDRSWHKSLSSLGNHWHWIFGLVSAWCQSLPADVTGRQICSTRQCQKHK